jgi:hypothetical protein
MITRESLAPLSNDELAYLYYCCDKEFDKNGYIYFDFDLIKIFKKQCIIDIIHKYSDTLSQDKKDMPCKIISKLEGVE